MLQSHWHLHGHAGSDDLQRSVDGSISVAEELNILGLQSKFSEIEVHLVCLFNQLINGYTKIKGLTYV